VTDIRMPPTGTGQPIENREASIPSPGHQRYVFRPAMVMIVGDVAGLPVPHDASLAAECVPDRVGAAVLRDRA